MGLQLFKDDFEGELFVFGFGLLNLFIERTSEYYKMVFPNRCPIGCPLDFWSNKIYGVLLGMMGISQVSKAKKRYLEEAALPA